MRFYVLLFSRRLNLQPPAHRPPTARSPCVDADWQVDYSKRHDGPAAPAGEIIQEHFRTHDGNARKLTIRDGTIAKEVCSLLDVVAEVTIKIQGGVDTHISQTMFNMLQIKEIIGDKEHWIRAPDQAYEGSDVLKENTSLDDSTSEVLKVRETLFLGVGSKGLGEAIMPLERICALLNPGRKDCSEEHLLNGSATPKADAIADVKNVAKTIVDPVVVPASPDEDGSGSSGENFGGGVGGSSGDGSSKSGSGSSEPRQPPPKRQMPSALEEKRRHNLASSKKSSSIRDSSKRKSTLTQRSIIERELRVYVAVDPTPEEGDVSLLDF